MFVSKLVQLDHVSSECGAFVTSKLDLPLNVAVRVINIGEDVVELFLT